MGKSEGIGPTYDEAFPQDLISASSFLIVKFVIKSHLSLLDNLVNQELRML